MARLDVQNFIGLGGGSGVLGKCCPCRSAILWLGGDHFRQRGSRILKRKGQEITILRTHYCMKCHDRKICPKYLYVVLDESMFCNEHKTLNNILRQKNLTEMLKGTTWPAKTNSVPGNETALMVGSNKLVEGSSIRMASDWLSHLSHRKVWPQRAPKHGHPIKSSPGCRNWTHKLGSWIGN